MSREAGEGRQEQERADMSRGVQAGGGQTGVGEDRQE